MGDLLGQEPPELPQVRALECGSECFLEARSQQVTRRAVAQIIDENGQPKRRADNTIDTRYGRGLAKDGEPDCRFCAVAAPLLKIDRSTWTDSEKDGAHNPKFCKRAIRAMLKEGALGSQFLWEQNKGARKIWPNTK